MIGAIIAAIAGLASAWIKNSGDKKVAAINAQIAESQNQTAKEIAKTQEEIELIKLREAILVKNAAEIKAKTNLTMTIIVVAGFFVGLVVWAVVKITTKD